MRVEVHVPDEFYGSITAADLQAKRAEIRRRNNAASGG